MKFGQCLEQMLLGKKMQLPGAGFTLSVEVNERSVPVELLKTKDGKVRPWKPSTEEILSNNWEVSGG